MNDYGWNGGDGNEEAVNDDGMNHDDAADVADVADVTFRAGCAAGELDGVARSLRAAVRRQRAMRRVHSGTAQAALCGAFGPSAVPEQAMGLAAYAESIVGRVVADAVNMASPRSFAHMTALPPEFMHVLADIASRLNQNLVKADASRSLTVLERQVAGMLHRLVYAAGDAFYARHVHDAAGATGIVCSGGTLANITALWLARSRCLAADPPGGGVEEEGLAAALRRCDAAGAVIVGSARMHYSFRKAAALLGLGRGGVIEVPVDARQRLDLRALEEVIRDCTGRRLRIVALVGVAGSTDCGSIDPLDGLADIAARERIHFHVDAAWGGALLFGPRRAALAGIERADTVTLDAHKQLYLPVGAGILLLRDPQAAAAIAMAAPYMLHDGSSDQGRFSIEGSRGGAALLMHGALCVLGRQGLAALHERHLANALRLAAAIDAAHDFELLLAPESNIVLYRYLPAAQRECAPAQRNNRRIDAVNRELQRLQGEAGHSHVSRTTIGGLPGYPRDNIVALRAIVANPFTGDGDFAALLAEQRTIGERLG